MPQRWKILYQWFQWGVGNHDTYLGKNQVAYAENVNLYDPEKVTLAQKAENYALTDNDLVLCKLESEYNWHVYLGTTAGKMYDKWNNIVLCTTAYAQAITNIFTRYSYIYWSMGNSRMWRIEPQYLVDGWSWVSWDLEAQSTYTESHKTNTSNFVAKRWEQDSTYFWAVTPSWSIIKEDNTLTTTVTTTVQWVPIWIWKTISYLKTFTHRGKLNYHDMANSILSADLDLDSFYIEGIYANNMELLVSWIKTENSFLFVPNGEWKQAIAQSRTSWPDAREVHYYGRKTNPLSSLDARYRQFGNDTHWTYNDICYMINKEAISCYGSWVPWMPKAWSFLNRNYNGDLIDEIGMIKVETESSTWNNRLYYSWRVGTTCWVDRIDLDKVNKQDTYQDSGYVYTQKLDFWDAKARINKVKLKGYTTTDATMKVYCSTDHWAWVLKGTLNGTDPKKYYLLDAHVEWYTVQRKIELETADEEVTPILYAFSFEYEIWDNE